MNSDTHETAVEILRDAGVAVPCATCGANDIQSYDGDAERQAYAMATNAWKGEERGFRGMTREAVMEYMKGATRDVNNKCPSCDREGD